MKRRSLVWIVLIVVAAGIGFAIYRRSSKPEETKLETAKVERGRLAARVTATGTLSALVTVQVGSQVSGRIAELDADFNSEVKKGQRIARIDPQLFEAALEQARANFQAAEANVLKAKAQAVDAERQRDRSKALAEKNLVAAAERDTAEANASSALAQVQAAEGSLAQARASLHQAEINLGYTTIVSPINGVVISRSVDVGQTVAASLQAPTLFTIAEDLRKMQVHTNVAEADVGKLAPGQEAVLRVDAYPNQPFTGTIHEIRNAAQTVQNVVTYDAVIDVNNPELKLRPGMTTNITITYAERDDALKVPNAALRFRPPPELLKTLGGEQGPGRRGGAGGPTATATAGAPGGAGGGRGQGGRGGGPGAGAGGEGGAGGWAKRAPGDDRKTVWVLRDGKPAPVRVKVGLTDGTSTELVEGELHEGDEVVTDAGGSGGAAAGGAGARPGGGAGGPGGAGGFRRMF